jgi:hypothetical protein
MAAPAAPTTAPVGWIDTRLARAYNLIDEVLLEHNNPESEANALLNEARGAVEYADVAIEKRR